MAGIYSFVWSGHEVYTGSYWQVVWHFVLAEDGENSAYNFAKNLANAVYAAVEDAWLDLLADSVMVDNISTRKLGGGPTFIRSIALGGTQGTALAGSLNEGGRIAWIMVDETHVGATIIPGIPTGALVDQAFTTAYADKVTDLSDILTDDITVGGGGGDANFTILNHQDSTEVQIVLEGVLRPRPSAIGRRTLR